MIERHFMAKIPSPKIKDQAFSSRKKRRRCTSACSYISISFKECLRGAREYAAVYFTGWYSSNRALCGY
jgi:hypothetical protein